MSTSLRFFATCPRGLENVLAAELAALGAQSLLRTDGGVGFAGDLLLCYRANLESRIATRILWQVGEGHYRSEEHLYQAARTLDWTRWFDLGQTFMVKVTALRCPLKSLEFITLKIKDAVCDRFREATGSRPDVATKRPDVRIHAFLTADSYRYYLDTSGDSLFIRGLRRVSVEAPLRENLAAGILKLIGWLPGTPLLDPMCGSGTFLLEAAMMAQDMAPGLGRHFGFERLKNFHTGAWRRLRGEAEARRRTVKFAHIYGSDVNGEALAAATRNLNQAGLLEAVKLGQQDITEARPPAPQGILVANPPYGVRVGEEEQLAALYPRIGEVLKKHFAGWNAWFLTADQRLPKLMRLTPSRKLLLYNGPLECRLYEFKMVAGSNRRPRRKPDE